MAGARDFAHVYTPIKALQDLTASGVLPSASTLVPGGVPTGLQASYDFTGVSGATVADATKALLTKASTTGLPVVLTAKPSAVPWWQQALSVVGAFAGVLAGGSFFAKLGSQVLTPSADTPASPPVANFVGGRNMGFLDDILGGISSAGNTIGGIFGSGGSGQPQSVDWSGLLNTVGGIATASLAGRVPVSAAGGAGLPAVVSGGGAIMRAARGISNRYPNLSSAIAGLRATGKNVSRAKLYGVLKRFGPEFLVTGGLMTAAAVNELAVAGPGYRRMNPANVRALRRSVRRIESFHRLCKTTDRLHSRRRHAKK